MKTAVHVTDWLLVLAVLAFFALTACASVPVRPQLDEPMRLLAMHAEGWAGFTMCGTVPKSYIADDRLDPVTRQDSAGLAGLRAHEAAHRTTASEFRSCTEYLVWLKHPVNQLRAEAFAYCVQAHVEFERGRWPSLGAAFVNGAKLLTSPTYPRWPMDLETAAELIALSCTKES